MSLELTPTSKSLKVFGTPSSGNHTPSTPQLPFDPPRRRSSLAFSKIMDSPTTQELIDTPQCLKKSSEDEPLTSHLNIGWKRETETPHHERSALSGCATGLEKVFQTAKANLQLDMHFASSPVGSIASRLPQPTRQVSPGSDKYHQVDISARTWRYSTVPKIFSTALSDVREPLAVASPTLPILMSPRDKDYTMPIEPTSSGYASPLSDHVTCIEVDGLLLPPLPLSTSSGFGLSKSAEFEQASISQSCGQDVSELTQPMTGLKVGSDFNTDEGLMLVRVDDSPVVEHLKRKSGYDYEITDTSLYIPNSIFLSKSAKAAAECARAKRGLLREAPEEDDFTEDGVRTGLLPQPFCHTVQKTGCPDPQLHHYMATHPCPDPFAHVVLSTEGYQSHPDAIRAQPRAWGNEYFTATNAPAGRLVPHPGGHRTTAAGSPMPFARRNRSPVRHAGHDRTDHPHAIVTQPPPTMLFEPERYAQQVPRHVQKPSEHFRPGWYYASESPQKHNRPETNLYSFSTAAAKATGESAAPDLRIRNSYRTDTLTPLARPQGRFRKNGLAATLRAPGSRRYYSHGPPVHASKRRAPIAQARRYEPPQFENIQIRSSPPRPSTHYFDSNTSRKRGANDSGVADFDMVEDGTPKLLRPALRPYQSEELMQVDDQTRAAVRMSLFGPNTPDSQQKNAPSMREISPNVKIWRKGGMGERHFRKKRRPSYWDGDLEEVRMSPAGRAGIQSSPPISKRSEVAEVEITSSYVGSIVADLHDAVDENTEANYELEGPTEAREEDTIDALERPF